MKPALPKAVQYAADTAGMPVGGWLRTIGLAAAEATPLPAQMRRAREAADKLAKGGRKKK